MMIITQSHGSKAPERRAEHIVSGRAASLKPRAKTGPSRLNRYAGSPSLLCAVCWLGASLMVHPGILNSSTSKTPSLKPATSALLCYSFWKHLTGNR